MANMKLRCILPAAMQQKGIYYYTTYENHQITAVDMHRENLDGGDTCALPGCERGTYFVAELKVWDIWKKVMD